MVRAVGRQTMMKPKLVDQKRFDEYLSQDESGLSEDERMMKIADRINSQFKKDEFNYKSGAKSVSFILLSLSSSFLLLYVA